MHRQMQVIFSVLIFFLLAVFYGVEANNNKVTGIGVIIDVKTRIGKEEKTAMEVAAQNSISGMPLESLPSVSCL